MKQTISQHEFIDAFKSIRPENFSYDGLELLFDYLTELEESCGLEYELDVIAICCDFCEQHWAEVADYYELDLSECEDDDERQELITDYLNERTMVCGVTDDGNIVYQEF